MTGRDHLEEDEEPPVTMNASFQQARKKKGQLEERNKEIKKNTQRERIRESKNDLYGGHVERGIAASKFISWITIGFLEVRS